MGSVLIEHRRDNEPEEALRVFITAFPRPSFLVPRP